MDAFVPSCHPAVPISETAKRCNELVLPHVESFNYFVDEGLPRAVEDLPAREFVLARPPEINSTPNMAATPSDAPQGPTMRLWIENATVGFPSHKHSALDARMFPWHARESGQNYAGPLTLTVARRVGDGDIETTTVKVGDIPIMVRSARCNLAGMSPSELTQHNEEAVESGGYFICNGIERIFRMLQVPRRNYPMAVTRSAYQKRGPLYSNKGIMIRCVRPDQSGVTLTLHYLNDGSAKLRFSLKKQEFFVPLVLIVKCLADISDREFYERCLGGDVTNAFLSDAVTILLRDHKRLGLQTRRACLEYLGQRFRSVLDIPYSLTDAAAGQMLMDRYILVHLGDDNAAKVDLLVLMARKLYGFVAGDVVEDNADSLMNQEILLPGHLYTMFIKEKLADYLQGIELTYRRDIRMGKAPVNLTDAAYFKKVAEKQVDIGRKAAFLINTGNMVSNTGLDLMQASGFTVVADKINYMRFMSHFRSVHRGQFFTTMKTTTVRKLLPESWGFICPVHTPDGGPCGLLNHLALNAGVVTHPSRGAEGMPPVLCRLGMTPLSGTAGTIPYNSLPVMLDGKVVGSVPPAVAPKFVAALRKLKTRTSPALSDQTQPAITAFIASVATTRDTGDVCMEDGEPNVLPTSLEVAYLPQPPQPATSEDGSATQSRLCGPFPGVFLSTAAARLIRPIRSIATGALEVIGPLEQVYMEIAATGEDVIDILGISEAEASSPSLKVPYTHVEVSPLAMLSVEAQLTPFSDCNQSPRNMYQCQMGKQTMGTPLHSFPHRADNKLYRIQNPQAPLVQNQAQRGYCYDEYPSGANAVVAVISYTGFDMEDAMIINKSSFERGFGHASVYKTIQIDVAEDNKKDAAAGLRFLSNVRPSGATPGRKGAPPTSHKFVECLDDDGLPPVGLLVQYGDPVYCVLDAVTGRPKITNHKELEPAYIDQVRLLGTDAKTGKPTRASIKLRFNRNPVVGDKFSSRHGQKGVLSVLWPQQDMPFSESGMSPDVIINPHAFPSRMTIGMLVESMAGKVGSMQGQFQDSTPFRFSERQPIVSHLGQQLVQAGYSYYGSEPMYSGTDGNELHADIFLGVVYYQRLRHMVSDKSQVRSTGPIHALTRQPVKGRKRHGGIRFGEMERDSLLAHGTAFLLRDRLFNCSDKHIAWMCKQCGSVLSTVTHLETGLGTAGKSAAVASAEAVLHRKPFCHVCDRSDTVTSILLPYVFRYLANELAAMSIRLTLEVGSV